MTRIAFADGVKATVMNVSIRNTYEGLLEGRLSGGTPFYLERIEERRALIESGKLKGFYCFEPELTEDYDWHIGKDEKGEPDWIPTFRGMCFKDLQLSCQISVSENGDDGEYWITLEWYQSSREVAADPLTALIQKMMERLKYKDIKKFCQFHDWEELS